jgi:membrane protein DedA with SNARE-associated domain
MLNGDHFMIFGEGDRLAGPILDFARRVEQGEAKSRSEATAERRARAAEPFDPSSAPKVGALALLAVMALLAIATLVSEDFACIAAGVLVARGRIAFLPATIACFGGILIGDLAVFWAGRLLGRRFLHRAPLRWFLSPAKVAISSRWFARRGPTVILFSRFLPGTRLPTYFAAGLLHTRFSRFFGYFLLAVALWTPAVVVVLVWLLLQGAEMLATHRGRRLLVGWWKRKVHWEFWPPWAFYPPLILWYLWLALRHRSLTLFTAANPAIPAGGFIGESKAAILERLPTEAVARFDRIEGTTTAAAKIKAVAAFRSRHHFDLPVVLKPDVGQRGTSVTIARTEAQIEEYCRAADFDFLVQAYIPGLEFGVFWAHLPGDRQGRIFSITEKRMPMVLGDGRSRLEDLVLADSRAVALAPLYLSLLGPEIERVPAAGEPVQLSELLDRSGADVVAPEPEAGSRRSAPASRASGSGATTSAPDRSRSSEPDASA